MKWIRKLLFPFSLLYAGVMMVRNAFYNWGWFKSKSYDIPLICVGNLSMGGTGKSPMIEYLVSLLENERRVAVLSRGYKRKTKGFQEVLLESTVAQVGDEPLQIKRKFPNIQVAVCEDRQSGIERLKESVDVILLDDAFQHRKVNPSFSILLTSFNQLYIDDCVVPAGNLREPRLGAKRADIVVVTKCPENLSDSTMKSIKKRLKLQLRQQIFFSKIGYALEIKSSSETQPLSFLKNRTFTLVTGIANPIPLVSFLKQQGLTFTHKSYGDHHNFTTAEISSLEEEELLLTTEKDFMRLQPSLGKKQLFYLPITTEFLYQGQNQFDEIIRNSLRST